jgi:uncharacterized membrane protein SirB2
MSYEFYKLLHIGSLFIFLSGLGISFLGESSNKFNKILTGITSLTVFIAGMGLILKGLSITHGESWPTWIHAKLVIWALLAIGGPILSKRLKKHRPLAFYLMLTLAVVAAYLAINKPV